MHSRVFYCKVNRLADACLENPDADFLIWRTEMLISWTSYHGGMSDDIEFELADVARDVLEICMGATEDDEVLVLGDPKKTRVARSFVHAARGMGATTTYSVMPLLDSHGNEPPRVVADAMAAADVAILCTTKAISHTDARRAATERGTKVGILRGVDEQMMIDGAMTVDFRACQETTKLYAAKIEAASHAHVTSENGTDVEFSLEGCPAFSVDGMYYEEGDFNIGTAAFPPGEAPTHPAEGTAQGDIVFDVSMDNIGRLDTPITITLEDGYVTTVSGGWEADALSDIFNRYDENARNLAEFAIGTNPKAKFIGNLAEDKKAAGTVHFAVGDNKSLGGSIGSEIHLDGVIKAPTVALDGEIVVQDGKLLL